jgi:V8-like Glu-specific endopeptidase
MLRCRLGAVVILAIAVSSTAMPAFGQAGAGSALRPAALTHSVQPLGTVEVIDVPPIDLDEVAFEDQQRVALGLAPRYAIPWEVRLTPDAHGTWETLDGKASLWRLRIVAPGALSLNLGFTGYRMPRNARLWIYATDYTDAVGPFSERDNEDHGELWTPVVLADDVMVEVTVPTDARAQLELELAAINYGYRGFGKDGDGEKSGWCNIDVVCPEGDDWRAEIRSVGVISTGGYLFCTGFLVNNTALDQTPYFITAHHCGIRSHNASSLVVYWNYESPTCGQQGGGSLDQYQTGSYWRAEYDPSDFTLVELDDDPDPAFNVTFAGWDRSGDNASMAVAIHHPSCDEKSISFEYQSTQTTSYLEYSSPGDGTHERVVDWDLGTTEPGSSGSPLFNQDHRVIGQLHGGYAACGNDESDWYGRFYTSWTGGGSSSSRLRDWLDPGNTGALFVDTLDPQAAGMLVSPPDGLVSSGDPGGPFTPDSKVYTIENAGSSPIDYNVTKNVDWLSITNGSGSIPPGGDAEVTVWINSNADSLGVGTYEDTVSFINTTNHQGDTTRPVSLEVGSPILFYSWNLSGDPGWSTEGQWAYGQPIGGGGDHGNPDPTCGHTGANVYGYNLNGDYANNLPERHLTTAAIDCTDLAQVTLRFWRWLGVESPDCDRAFVRVSNNGSDWTTVWENGVEITDSAWVQQEYDIAAVADNQPTVYIRWTMGPTDYSWRYCGWNVDDVQIWAVGEPPISGDLDRDGDVDLDDLTILLASYGVDDGGDINGDGVTDLVDLAALLVNYGYGV